MSKRTGEIRKFKTPELCQTEIDETIKNNTDMVSSVFARVIGMKLRKIRLEKNLTQTDLAMDIGTTFQQYQKVEKCYNRIFAEQLMSICNNRHWDISIFNSDPHETLKNGSNVIMEMQ